MILQEKKQKYFQLMDWPTKNKDLLDAIVITGGEPTIHPSLPVFIKKIKT